MVSPWISMLAALLGLGLQSGAMPGLHNDSQAEMQAGVDRIFAPWDRQDSPGCAVVVVRDQRVLYTRGYGMADLEQKVPITTSTVFDTGSMAKQFTAMAIALLVEKGKLDLDDDVHKYLPELPGYGKTITIRHLLHHTSGLREQHDLLRLAGWRWQDLVTESDILDLVVRQRELSFTPGEEFLYSNTNYVLLAVVVQRASGSSLAEFAAEHIFRPLGMTSTRFLDDHDTIVPGRSTGHISRQGGGFAIWNPAFDFVGSTSLYSTVEDLARWDGNFYTPRVGSQETLALLRKAGQLADGTELAYGLGLELGTYRGWAVESHSGSDPGFRAELFRLPEQRLSVGVLCNLMDISATALARQVINLYLAPELAVATRKGDPPIAAPAPAVPASELASFAGLYWSESIEGSHKLVVEGGDLRLATSEGMFPLTLIAPRVFQLMAAPRRFIFTFGEPDRPGATPRLRLEVAGQKAVDYAKVVSWVPVAAELVSYAGEYRSEETRAQWTVAVRGAQLVLLRAKFKPEPLQPVIRDVFQASFGVVRFVREEKPRVIGLSLTTERSRHIRFTREAAGRQD
jgi:CubicO group peptidase (beta-lactamase class C family)